MNGLLNVCLIVLFGIMLPIGAVLKYKESEMSNEGAEGFVSSDEIKLSRGRLCQPPGECGLYPLCHTFNSCPPKESEMSKDWTVAEVLETAKRLREKHKSGLGIVGEVLGERLSINCLVTDNAFHHIFEAGGTPRVVLTTHRLATAFLHLNVGRRAQQHGVSFAGVEGLEYTEVHFYAPRSFRVLVLPHNDVPQGHFYVLDSDNLDKDEMQACLTRLRG